MHQQDQAVRCISAGLDNGEKYEHKKVDWDRCPKNQICDSFRMDMRRRLLICLAAGTLLMFSYMCSDKVK